MQRSEDPTEAAQKKRPARGKEKILAAVCCLLAAFLLFLAGWFGHWLSLGRDARALLWAVDTAERNFYFGVDRDALYAEFFDDLSLDPYSEFYTKEEYAAIRAEDRGESEGFGVSLTGLEAGGGMRLYRVAGNSPAERAGLLAGMYVFAYGEPGGELVTGGTEAFLEFAEGRSALCLSCGFEADGSDAKTYCVERGEYALSECLYRDSGTAVRYLKGEGITETLAGGIADFPETAAYLRVDAFHADAAEELGALLSYMRSRGRRDLVLDLRRNGGGEMSVLQKMAAYLMREAEGDRPVAAVARYKDGSETRFNAAGNFFSDFFAEDAEIYVLADANTASASECLLGALLSYKTLPYSHIVLRKGEDEAHTYGKGIMQSHYTDAAGNVLKLTSAKVFWPDGTCIHGKGIRESDGAIGIAAPALCGAEDEMLAYATGILSGKTA